MRLALSLLLGAGLLGGCATTATPPRDDVALRAAIAGPQRDPANVARDGARHPYETLRFFGIRPDMTVVEIWPGGGWYTEILAPYLKPQGKLYAAHFDPDTQTPYFRDSRAKFEAKLAAQPEIYGAVEITAFDPPGAVAIAPPDSADLVLTFRNVHNWYMRGGGEVRLNAAFHAMYTALKPGGVLGIVDHRLPSSRPASEQEDSGYMLPDVVITAAERVGFKLVESSEINANPKDTADHPNGVWTLPPTLRIDAAQRERYRDIGESDRMTLKFVKPRR
jgi:predicted methyltransferase